MTNTHDGSPSRPDAPPAELADLDPEIDPGDLLEERVVRALRSRGLVGAARRAPRRASTTRPGPSGRSRVAWWAAAVAAGVALFLGGFAAGQSRATAATADLVRSVRGSDAQERAALVQQTGSLYVTALAALADDGDTGDDAGREVALAAFRAAMGELVRLHPNDARVARMLDLLSEDASADGTSPDTRQIIWF